MERAIYTPPVSRRFRVLSRRSPHEGLIVHRIARQFWPGLIRAECHFRGPLSPSPSRLPVGLLPSQRKARLLGSGADKVMFIARSAKQTRLISLRRRGEWPFRVGRALDAFSPLRIFGFLVVES